jgi:hypothetical protein
LEEEEAVVFGAGVDGAGVDGGAVSNSTSGLETSPGPPVSTLTAPVASSRAASAGTIHTSRRRRPPEGRVMARQGMRSGGVEGSRRVDLG